MGAFNDPSSCLRVGVALGRGFLAAGAQMQREAERLGEAAWFSVVEALVETDMVRRLRVRPRPMHWNCLKRLPHELVVVAVRAVDDHAERNAAAVGQHGALDPALAAVGWVAAGFSPPNGAFPIAPSSASQVQSMGLNAS